MWTFLIFPSLKAFCAIISPCAAPWSAGWALLNISCVSACEKLGLTCYFQTSDHCYSSPGPQWQFLDDKWNLPLPLTFRPFITIPVICGLNTSSGPLFHNQADSLNPEASQKTPEVQDLRDILHILPFWFIHSVMEPLMGASETWGSRVQILLVGPCLTKMKNKFMA